MSYRCEQCGAEGIAAKGRTGHVKFSSGDGHGPKDELPDDYSADRYFSDDGDAGEEDDDLPDECRKCGDRDRMDGSMVCEQCSDDGDGGGDSAEQDSSGLLSGLSTDRVRRGLFDDVRAFWGGDDA